MCVCEPTNNQAKATAINFLFADRQRGIERESVNFTKQNHDNDEMYAKSYEN